MAKLKISVLLLLVGLFHSATLPPRPTTDNRATNIILLIGDGMGLSQVSAHLHRQSSSVFERFPVVGFQKTYALNNLVTDSAASATAMSTGQKTLINHVATNANNEPLVTITQHAKERGLATGAVVSCSLPHATPAAFFAHAELRGMFTILARDILNSRPDLLVGGGREYFDGSIGPSLLDDLQQIDYKVRAAPVNFDKLDVDAANPRIYFTSTGEPRRAEEGRTYLPAATTFATRFLPQRSDVGFFLLVEGSQIDWALHDNNTRHFEREMVDFEKTIQRALDFARQDGNTLVVVTADHETGGLALEGTKSKQKLSVDYTTKRHTAAMVPVFAYGPGADRFAGIYENTGIYERMIAAFGWEGAF